MQRAEICTKSCFEYLKAYFPAKSCSTVRRLSHSGVPPQLGPTRKTNARSLQPSRHVFGSKRRFQMNATFGGKIRCQGLTAHCFGVLKCARFSARTGSYYNSEAERCHFLQTSPFCWEVRGQAQAVAACLCLHCLLLI